ncbi:MAG: hypothetical protein MUE40_19400 [Anaerolineae bacterium]|nr:hypothetical protein [Anaerolineae bacterium]
MDNVVEYTTQIIDLCDLLLQHQERLSADQREHIATIYRRAVGFITEFMECQPGTIQAIASYLNHDALSPVTIMVGYSELLLMGGFGDLDEVVTEVVGYIRDYSYALMDELKDLQTLLVELRTRLTRQPGE